MNGPGANGSIKLEKVEVVKKVKKPIKAAYQETRNLLLRIQSKIPYKQKSCINKFKLNSRIPYLLLIY